MCRILGHFLPMPAEEELQTWVERQQQRHSDGSGFSFTIVEASTDQAVGHCGLWLKELGEGRATAGYSIVASTRGRGLAADALTALTAFAGQRRDMLLYAAIREESAHR